MTTAPRQWRVIWGSWLRPGYTDLVVEAHDVDEALVLAAEKRPDLPRPRIAFLVGGEPIPRD